jgi:hypothetical protein
MIPDCVAGKPHHSKSIGVARPDRLFLTIAPEALRVFSNQPDSQHFWRSAEPDHPVATAFPDGSRSFADTAREGGNPFMLPGFRFLFAAIVLSISMLIFGLGAAALLRAAHEEFTSIPSRRPPLETMFAQRSDAGPVLAMLRAEPSVADEKAIDPPITDQVQDQPPIVSTPAESGKPVAEPDKVAALTYAAAPPENSPSSEASETAAPEIPIQAETSSAQTDDTPLPAAEAKVAAIAEMTPTAPDPAAVTAPDQAAVPIDDNTRIAETRIATLGGPAVIIETQTPLKNARAVVGKSAQAKRVVKRRKVAAPARPTQQAAQRPADPFGQPFGR